MPDLLGGPVTGTSEPIRGVFIRQMRSDQTRSGEMKLSGFNGTEQFWMFSRSAGHGDSLVGHAFREVQYRDAELKHRGMSLLEIETPGVDFAQDRDQFTFEFVVAMNEMLKILQELAIGTTLRNRRERHD